MANWIPILILIPFVFSVVLMLGRNLGGNAARWIGLVGTLATLTACLAISGAYFRFISENPASVSTDDAGNVVERPVNPQLNWHYNWLNLSGPGIQGSQNHATRLDFHLGV